MLLFSCLNFEKWGEKEEELCRFIAVMFVNYIHIPHLSILLSFGIDRESRLPFFIADGIDDCAIAVEFRRFTVNDRLLATCKAALALRRRGGESLEFPATFKTRKKKSLLSHI